MKYISEDPIGFVAEDENLYRYVGNNPVRHIDPYGLSAADVKRIQDIIQNVVAEMTRKGERLSNGRLNFLAEMFFDYKQCWQQTQEVFKAIQKAIDNNKFDDEWHYDYIDQPLSYWNPFMQPYHVWGAAWSNNPSDPVVIFDPMYNKIDPTVKK